MAHTASSEDIPRPPLSRPHLGLVALAFLALLLIGFGFLRASGPATGDSDAEVPLVGTPGSIRTYGSIPELYAGDTGPKLTLSDMPKGPGVVAIGSLEKLGGEIATVRGTTWLSYPAPGDRILVENRPSLREKAGFLAVADVPGWQSETFTEPVTFERLATLIEERAQRAGVDTSGPLPLLIDGAFTAIELNVANGPALGDDKPTPERLRTVAIKARVPSAEGTLVGFFAAGGGERLLHPGERLHLHVVLPAARLMGHLDAAQLEPGAQLHLPAAR